MLHNNKLCKKIYRLELSNIPYIIHKNDLDLLYKMVWYISYKYNILGYEGTIVNKMLNNNYDSIICYSNKVKMTANNYIDFEMSDSEYDNFTLKYDNAIRSLYYMTVYKTGLMVNRKGINSIIAKVYGIPKKPMSYTYEDYEFYVRDSKYDKIFLGYAKTELKVQKLECAKEVDDMEEILNRLSTSIYTIYYNKYESYNSYVNSVNEEIQSARESEGLDSGDDYYNPRIDTDTISIDNMAINNGAVHIDSLGMLDWTTLSNRPITDNIIYSPP